MSNGYGIDIYGLQFYGYSQPADYSVTPFVANQTGYGEITLYWSSPNATTWKLLHLVRSQYGYPSSPIDGVLLQEVVPSRMIRTYDDTGLTPGLIYYYTIFISLESPTYSNSVTYNAQQQVLYQGSYYTCVSNGTIGQTPTIGAGYWVQSDYIPVWYPAGYAATLSLTNHGYGTLLYNRTPQPYKTTTSDTFTNAVVDNQPLQNYLNVFGFGLDLLKTSYDSYLLLNDPDSVSASNLDILGQQLGIATDYLSTPQQRRQRIKNASVNYRLKGQTQSIHNLIADLTGWDSDITYGPNMYNSADQTSFPHPAYDTWNVNTTYFLNNLVQYNGHNYKCLTTQAVGQSQAPTGTNANNTWWSFQNLVLDSSTNLNPQTGKYSSYTVTPNSGTTAVLSGVVTGIVDPINANILTTNALASTQQTNFSLGSYELISSSPLLTPNYGSSTSYVANNYVLYTDGYYYKALKTVGFATPAGVITPGTNNKYWQAIYYTTADRPNIVRDGIPIPQLQTWNPTTKYTARTQVQYNGIVYMATLDNINSQPTGFYYSNANWAFIEPSQQTLVASSWWARGGTDTTDGVQATTKFQFYDENSNLINNTATNYTGYNVGVEGVTARFVADWTDLNGTTEAGLANAQSDGTVVSGNWASTPSTVGMWRTSYGQASVNQTLAGTTTYVYTLIDVGAPSGRICVTFSSDYLDTAHKTHGIVFDWVDANNFYYVTRQSLWQVVAGVETKLKTWTRLKTGDRIVVDVTGDVVVYKYSRTSDGHLQIIANATGLGPGFSPAVGKVGLIQKYSASGAL